MFPYLMPLVGPSTANQGLAQGWSKITSIIPPPVYVVLMIIGAGVAAWALIVFFKEKRKGSGGNPKALAWGLGAGVVIAWLFPVVTILLTLLDAAVNFLIKVNWSGIFGG